MQKHHLSGLAAVAASVVMAGSASAIDVVLDYSHTNFFNTNLTAKAALEAAAQDISDVIVTSLSATTDTSAGTFGSTTVSFNFNYTYTNPTTGSTVAVSNAVRPADEVRIFVGMRTLSGTTLGTGGPGGFGYSSSASGVVSEVPQAVDAAEAAANANMGRGGGPIIGSLSGSFDGISNSDFTINFGSSLGHLWFDDDSVWHYDHTTPVTAGANDFYSVALHEILHALGIGTADSWDSLVSGTNWTGSNVIALLGSGSGVIDGGGGHIAESLEGHRLSDGMLQEAVMDPNITVGTRKTLTDLDLAFLADIGWEVVPEPATVTLLALGMLAVATRRRAA